MLKQAQEMKGAMEEIQKKLQSTTFSSTAANGKIEVQINGDLVVKGFKVDKELLKPENQASLEKALVQVTNDAIKKSKDAATSQLSQISGDLLPGGMSGAGG